MNSDILKGMLQDPKAVGSILKECEKELSKQGKIKSKVNANEQEKNLEALL
jgi:hypothetical protein